MKTSSFTVGISDLISDNKTKSEIKNRIEENKKDVRSLIEKIQVGLFVIDTGKSNNEEFELSKPKPMPVFHTRSILIKLLK